MLPTAGTSRRTLVGLLSQSCPTQSGRRRFRAHANHSAFFYMDKTMMVFGDAKKVVEDMVKAVE